jgi:hypothetical protein
MIWLAFLTVILGFVYLLNKMHNRKDKKASQMVMVEGFPLTHMPVEMSREEAESIVHKLKASYLAVWAKCAEVYGAVKWTLPISMVVGRYEDINENHPLVEWYAPHGPLYLKIHGQMFYYFAAEVHNCYRCALRGVNHIYETVDDEDQKLAESVDFWISDSF